MSDSISRGPVSRCQDTSLEDKLIHQDGMSSDFVSSHIIKSGPLLQSELLVNIWVASQSSLEFASGALN